MDIINQIKNDEIISVIVPIYNGEKYIGRCLDSILANDYPYLEIICINDGSKDNSATIVNKYLQKDNRIKMIEIENSGVSIARNIGLDNCTGEYVSFIDADDFIHHQFFSTLFYQLKSSDAEIAASGWRRVYANDDVTDCVISSKAKQKKYENSELLYSKFSDVCWAKLYKKRIVSQTRFSEKMSFGEDTIFIKEVLCSNKDKKSIIIDETMYYYFQSSESATHSQVKSNYCTTKGIVEYAINKSEKCANVEDASYWIRIAVERALGYRYAAYKEKEYEYQKVFNTLSKKSVKVINRLKLINLKKRLIYTAFAYFPFLYRMIASTNKEKE